MQAIHKYEVVLKDANQSIFCDQRGSSTNFGDPLIPSVLVLLEYVGSILQDIDESTILLGETGGPCIQEVELLTASILADLKRLITLKNDTARLTTSLQDDILQRHRKLFILSSIFYILLQVATLLTPQHSNGIHCKCLGESLAYMVDRNRAVKLIHKPACYFIRDDFGASPTLHVVTIKREEKLCRFSSVLDEDKKPRVFATINHKLTMRFLDINSARNPYPVAVL